MTPPCVVPTFRPYAAENLEFGGFYASSCESRVNLEADPTGRHAAGGSAIVKDVVFQNQWGKPHTGF